MLDNLNVSPRYLEVYDNNNELLFDDNKWVELNNISDYLDDDILKKYNLCSISDALRDIHFPKSMEMIHKARKRLAFDEFFFFMFFCWLWCNTNILGFIIYISISISFIDFSIIWISINDLILNNLY